MDLTAFPATSAAGSAKDGPVANNANVVKLAANLLDSGNPASPSNGWTWLVSISATEYELRAQVDGAIVAVLRIVKTGNKLKFAGNPDVNLQQLVNARLEHYTTATIPAVGAGNEGLVGWDSDLEVPFWVGSAFRRYFDGYDLDDPPFDEIDCDLNVTGLAGDAATPSTATRHDGFLLAATKKLNAIAARRIPSGYVSGSDGFLEVEYLLAAAETANDVTNLDGELRSVAETESINQAATALVAIADDIAAATAQYTLHRARLTLPAASLAAGDQVSVELLRGTAGGAGEVDGIIVVRAKLLVPVTRSPKVDE